jgi:hypothetical protein
MKRFKFAVLLAMPCLVACTDSARLSNETIGRVVRKVGFSCEGAVNVQALGASNRTWRVACANTETYTAAVQDNGDLCVEPLFLGDGGPAPQVLPTLQSRCAAL